MRSKIVDTQNIWEAYDNQVNTQDTLVNEFLQKMKSPFAKPEGNTAPAAATGSCHRPSRCRGGDAARAVT